MAKQSPRCKTKESVALAAFFKITEQWELTAPQQMRLLGMASKSTFFGNKNAPESARIGQDRLERLSYILGIYKDLQILFVDQECARTWIKKPNFAKPFCGRSALDYLTKRGRILDLHRVRQYLAGQRGV